MISHPLGEEKKIFFSFIFSQSVIMAQFNKSCNLIGSGSG